MACNFQSLTPSPYPMYIVFTVYFMGLGSYSVGMDSLVFNKVCLHSLANSSSLCSNTSVTQTLVQLQDDTALWSNYMLMVFLLPVLMSALMLSSYCDRVGYKLPFVLPLVGAVLSMVIATLLSTQQFLDWPLSTLFVYSFISGLFGNYPMILMAGFSYLSAISPERKRSMNFAIAEGCFGLGGVLGYLFTGPVLEAFGLDKLFLVNLGLASIALVTALVFVKDPTRENGENRFTSWQDILGFKRLADAFVCVFKSRPDSNRLRIHLSLAAFFFAFSGYSSVTNVTFLYIVKELGESVSTYGYWSAAQSACRAVLGPLFIFVMKRIFLIDEFAIAVSSCALTSIGFIVLSLGPGEWLIWSGSVILCLQVNVFAITRGYPTKLIEQDEIGKLFAYMSVAQLTVGTLGGVAYKALYPLALTFWPAFLFAISAFQSICALVILVILSFLNVKVGEKMELHG